MTSSTSTIVGVVRCQRIADHHRRRVLREPDFVIVEGEREGLDTVALRHINGTGLEACHGYEHCLIGVPVPRLCYEGVQVLSAQPETGRDSMAALLCNRTFLSGLHGRSGRTRTCNPRFWRPVLYQLSYTPRRPTVYTGQKRPSPLQPGGKA
jgi:hypothetical protein